MDRIRKLSSYKILLMGLVALASLLVWSSVYV